MSRMSGPKRKKVYAQLVRRDGEICFIGSEALNSSIAVVDHWNGFDSDNRLSNLHLMCRSMNTAKNPRGKSKSSEILSSVCVRRPAPVLIARPNLVVAQCAEFLQNRKAEPDFRHWLFFNIVRCGEIDVEEVVGSGSEFAHCSTETVRRYLLKLTSKTGIYAYKGSERDGSFKIVLKSEWQSFRRKADEKRLLDYQAENWKNAIIETSNAPEIDDEDFDDPF